MPECRVYELVTPPYTEGMPVVTPTDMFAVSADGSRLIGSSFGAFAGTEEDEANPNSPLPGTAYELSRSATGWGAYALGPPQSAYASAGMYDASADLEGTVWELGRLSQPEGVSDLYVERPRGRSSKWGRPPRARMPPTRASIATRGPPRTSPASSSLPNPATAGRSIRPPQGRAPCTSMSARATPHRRWWG